MVNPVGNVGYQPSAQPAAVAAPEPKARPETIQPRNAPAADSQKPDRRTLESRDQKKKVEVELRDRQAEPKEDPAPQRSSSDRGRVVDVSA